MNCITPHNKKNMKEFYEEQIRMCFIGIKEIFHMNDKEKHVCIVKTDNQRFDSVRLLAAMAILKCERICIEMPKQKKIGFSYKIVF